MPRLDLRDAPTSLLLPLVLLSAAPAIPSPAAAQGVFDDRAARFSFAGVGFPAVVDTFAAMQATRWPDPALGVGLSYASPMEVDLDLYVYPVRSGPADASPEALLEAEFRKELVGIGDYYRERGGEVEVEIEDTVSVRTPRATYRGWMGAAILRRGAEARRSVLYLFEKDGAWLKYRVTHHRGQRDTVEPHIRRFLEGTLDGITPP